MRTNHPNRKGHNWLIYRAMDQWLERCSPLIKGHVLDLGAGEAPYRAFFTALSNRYTTVDWGMSQHRINVDIVTDLNEPLPIVSGEADTVICISVLEHLRSPEALLSEASRALRPGGALLLQVPWQWMIHEAPHDFFRYTPFALEFMLKNAGFDVESIAPLGGFFSTISLKLNYFSRRLIRGPRLVRSLASALLQPLWFAGQWAALLLDHLDAQRMTEAPGYCVVATRRDSPSPTVPHATTRN